MSAVLDSEQCRVGCGITAASFSRQRLIPLTLGRRTPKAYLDVSHRFQFDAEGLHLADSQSRFAIHASEQVEPWFRFEYARGLADHPEVHCHVHGDVTVPLPDGVAALRKQHLPQGGRRFRLSLEDVIEFLVRENYAEARPDWQAVIAEHRERWYRLQLQAAVRRDPVAAIEQLRADGQLPANTE